jgi:hypothetical protein
VAQLLNSLLPALVQCRSTLKLLPSNRQQHPQRSISNSMGQLSIRLTSPAPKEHIVILSMTSTLLVRFAATPEATKSATLIQHLMMTQTSWMFLLIAKERLRTCSSMDMLQSLVLSMFLERHRLPYLRQPVVQLSHMKEE